MIINPFLNENSNTVQVIDDKKDFINNIIENILNEYGSLFADNNKSNNYEFVKKIIKEKIMQISFVDSDIEEEFVNIIMNKFFGYDVLQKHIDDVYVSDIRAVGYNNIYIKTKGVWIKTNSTFEDEKDFLNFIRGCVIKNGGKINNENPLVAVSDKQNNLRIETGISPVNVFSPSIVIRIHRKNNYNRMEDLLFHEEYMFNAEMYKFLIDIVNNRSNIVISGKGGSGKTTLLRTLINKIPKNKSIVLNEETSELMIEDLNVIQRECIQNKTNEKSIGLDYLLKQSMIMSADYLVVGEIKGGEAFFFLDSISTGHVGYTTIHANSSKNTIDRLCLLIKRNPMAVTYTVDYIEKFLATNINYIIYMENFKIKEIVEIQYDYKKTKIIYNMKFEYMKEKFFYNHK